MFNTNLFFNTGGTLTPAPNLYLRAEGANLNSRIYSSSDFTTWTARTGNLDTGSNVAVNSFAYSPTLGITVAVCDNRFSLGSGSIFYSSNAISWTGTLLGAYRWQKVIWAPELSKFFAIGLAGEVASSSNGTSWSVGSAGSGSGEFGSITWSPELGLLAACRNSTSTTNVVTSPDGVTWTARNFPVGNMTCTAIQWCGGTIQKFIAVGFGRIGGGGGTINSRWYSTDGITWISTQNVQGPYATGTAYSNTLGLVLYVTQNPDISIYRSSDGINWSSIPTSLQFTDIVWVENKRRFIASGLNATFELGFSTDGINWTFSAASPSEDQSAIGFAGI